MLALNDPRWAMLATHNGSGASIPRWLTRLLAHPDDLALFNEECWSLCSDEVTWSAAFAAAPYVAEAARRAQPAVRLEYVCFLGMMAMYRIAAQESEPSVQCPPDLEAGFQGALAAALEMAVAILHHSTREADVRGLLATIAAFKGFTEFARGIVDLQHDKRVEPPEEDIEF